jgi:hypothetical protein
MDKLTLAGNIMNSQMDAGMMDPSTDLNVYLIFVFDAY